MRASIGLAGQYAAVDENLTAAENLRLVGRLTHVSESDIKLRTDALLERFDLLARGRPAGAHVLGRHAPPPRPRGRAGARAAGALPRRAHDRSRPAGPHRALDRHRGSGLGRHHGAADDAVPRGGGPARRSHRRDRPRLGHRRGYRGGAEGPPGRDGDRARLRRRREREPSRPRSSRRSAAVAREGHVLRVNVSDGATAMLEIVRVLDAAQLAPTTMALREPTLDDVFLELTGHTAEEPTETDGDAPPREEVPTRPTECLMTATTAPGSRAARGPPPSGRRCAHDGVAEPAQHPPQPPAARVRHDPAGHLRADVPLRVRRGDRGHVGRASGSVRRLPHARDLRADRRRSARSRPASGSPRTSRRASSTGSGRCRSRARRCCVGRTWADLVRNVFVVLLMAVVGFLVGWRINTNVLRLDRRPRARPRVRVLAVVGVRDRRARRRRTPRPRRPRRSRSWPRSSSRRRPSCPSSSMPGWLQVFANHQPVTAVVDAARALTLGGPTQTYVIEALAWIIGIIVVCAPLAVRRYRQPPTGLSGRSRAAADGQATSALDRGHARRAGSGPASAASTHSASSAAVLHAEHDGVHARHRQRVPVGEHGGRHPERTGEGADRLGAAKSSATGSSGGTSRSSASVIAPAPTARMPSTPIPSSGREAR